MNDILVPNPEPIILDGKEITEEILQEKQRDPSIRLIRESANRYRTLTRLTE